MAVFGIPVAHEDDALRAVRAAEEMRDEVTSLREELRRERAVDFSVRIGVNTGPAVTGGAATGGSFTAGDTVNTAARLEQAARPGDVLLGQDTYSLVRHAVDAEPLPPLTAKGKSGAAGGAAPRRGDAGCTLQASCLAPARQWSDASASGDAYWTPFIRPWPTVHAKLFTVLGSAGVGKSRLVTEVLETIDGAATVSHLAAACHIRGRPDLVAAERGAARIESLDEDPEPGADDAAGRLVRRGAEPTMALPVPPDEVFWAVRRMLESLARQRPARPGHRRPAVGGAARSSTSSSTSPTGRATRRCSCSSWRARSCSIHVQLGAAGKPNATSVSLEAARGGLMRPSPAVALVDPACHGEPPRGAHLASSPRATRCIVEGLVAMLTDHGLLTTAIRRKRRRGRSPCRRRSMLCSPRASTG